MAELGLGQLTHARTHSQPASHETIDASPFAFRLVVANLAVLGPRRELDGIGRHFRRREARRVRFERAFDEEQETHDDCLDSRVRSEAQRPVSVLGAYYFSTHSLQVLFNFLFSLVSNCAVPCISVHCARPTDGRIGHRSMWWFPANRTVLTWTQY